MLLQGVAAQYRLASYSSCASLIATLVRDYVGSTQAPCASLIDDTLHVQLASPLLMHLADWWWYCAQSLFPTALAKSAEGLGTKPIPIKKNATAELLGMLLCSSCILARVPPVVWQGYTPEGRGRYSSSTRFFEKPEIYCYPLFTVHSPVLPTFFHYYRKSSVLSNTELDQSKLLTKKNDSFSNSESSISIYVSL